MKHAKNYKQWLIVDARRHLGLCAIYRKFGNDAMWKRHMVYAQTARRLAGVL